MQQQTLTENHLSGRLLTLSVLCGLAAGLMAVAYRFALSQAELLWAAAVDFARAHGAPGVAGWFLVLAALSLCVRQLLRLEPLISGSGIPQFEGEVTGQLHARWLRVLLCKALGGILCVFGGLSLGREGPSVQLGAMAAKGIAGAGKFGRQHQHLLITCGASAGLAAAFNAPLAGVLFALEEVHKTFSPAMLISAMTAATVADCVSKFFFGTATVFSFPLAVPLSLRYYGLVILIGLLTGAAGGLYNHCTLGAMKVCGRVPERVRMLLPFCAAGLLGFTLPQVLGGGHRMIELLNQGSLALGGLLALLLIKFLFSLLSFCSGAPGGIFFPLLVLGAYLGAAFSQAVSLFGVSPIYFNNFIILGMLGMFVAIVRAPITGIVLILEMTGSFSHLPSMTAVAAIAYLTAAALRAAPIYDSLLERILKKRASAPREAKI